MLFHDRVDAGHRLAKVLRQYRGKSPLILAIPRGAVPMGRAIADDLEGELDIVMVRKIGAPYNPEYALGAVDESGWVYRNPWAGDDPDTLAYIEAEKQVQLDVLRSRRARYTPGRHPVDPAGRIVIVVDDGLATGSTMMAALHALRGKHPAKLICAVPVAPADVVHKIGPYADEVVCLETPADFQAVGQFYSLFNQVEDEEVERVLHQHPPAPGATKGRQATRLGAGAPPVQTMVRIPVDGLVLEGEWHPGDGQRLVVFAHGSGSSRHSPRNRHVAQVLNEAGIGTLLFDMLTAEEDRDETRRFDIELLTRRLLGVTAWLQAQPNPPCSIGYFGASTGAAAALRAAAQLGRAVQAVVSRGGRPDLAGTPALGHVACPTLLIVGSLDHEVLELNRMALSRLGALGELVEIPGATHLFEEPGSLDQVARTACRWLERHLHIPANPDAG